MDMIGDRWRSWLVAVVGTIVAAALAAVFLGSVSGDGHTPQVSARTPWLAMAGIGSAGAGPMSGGAGDEVEAAGRVGIPADFEPCEALVIGGTELVLNNAACIAEIVAAIDGRVPVLCLVCDEHHGRRVQEMCDRRGVPPGAIHFAQIPYQSRWIRDFGPLFVRRVDGNLQVVDAQFARPGLEREDQLPRYLAGFFRLPLREMPMLLEGGNLLSNGRGLYISTYRVLVANEVKGREIPMLQQMMRDYCEVQRWLAVPPLQGEPTGHLDLMVTLTAPNVAVVAQADPAADPVNAQLLDEATERIGREQTPLGPMKVFRIPLPSHQDGIWRTYNNVLFANGALLVPQYPATCPSEDAQALAIFRKVLPEWEIVGIDCEALVRNQGALHCLAINVPLLRQAEVAGNVPSTAQSPVPESMRRARGL